MIAIDAVPAAKKQKTGVEWYVYHLLKKMNELNPELDVVLYSHRPIDFELKGKWTNKVLEWNLPGWSKVRWSWELFVSRPDLIFVPGDELPIVLPGKVVTTIHDLGFVHHSEYYTREQLVRQNRAHSRAVRIADKIITVSDATRLDLISKFKADASKIETIHLGFDGEVFKVRSSDDKDVERVKSDYGLKKPYMLYVGRLEKKKGIAPFLKTWIAWKDQSDNDVDLVLAGLPGAVGYDNIRKIIESRSDILEIGHVQYSDLGPIRSGAVAEVFPTRFEGFGMPVIEAMASGVPFICSDIPVMREVGKDAPIYVPLDARGSWMRALDEVMNPETRDRMRKLGLDRAKDFSWDTTARKTLDLLCSFL